MVLLKQMTQDKPKVISDFFLDGAKIMFASLVVGVFVPGAAGTKPWLTFSIGIITTILFLGIAVKLSKMDNL